MWDPSGESAEFAGILLRSEVPSTPPRLVADAPKPNVEGLHISGSSSNVRQGRGACWRVAVFHPTVKFSGRKAAHIGGQIGLSPDKLAKMDEFIRSELVRIVLMACRCPALFTVAPEIRAPRTFVGRANTIAPVVAVGEAAARITDYRGLDFAHFFNQLRADSVDVGHFGIFADPHAVVDYTT